MSRGGFACIHKQHVATAAEKAPSIKSKRVIPHVLQCSTAMTILPATGDMCKISFWLSHADMKTTEWFSERMCATTSTSCCRTRLPTSNRGVRQRCSFDCFDP